jgi:hypothetical protein
MSLILNLLACDIVLANHRWSRGAISIVLYYVILNRSPRPSLIPLGTLPRLMGRIASFRKWPMTLARRSYFPP